MVWKLFLWSSFRKSYSICWENSDMAEFGPFKAIFWPKLTVLRVFDLKLPNAAMNLPNFWYGSCSYGPLWENHTVYAWKILIWWIFGHLSPKFGHLLGKNDSFERFWPITPKRRYESSSFLVWKLLLSSSLRKSYSICCKNSDMAKFGPFKAIFGQNWQFWEFFTFNFQTPLWIFLIFGMEVVLMVFFEKIILYMPGKFWYGRILAI